MGACGGGGGHGGTAGSGITTGSPTGGSTGENLGAPTISSTSPSNGDPSAPTSRRVTATFSEPMTPSSINETTFKVSSPAGPLAATVSYVDNTATLQLLSSMPANTHITATVTTGAKDKSGVPLASNYTWSFTTGSVGDTTPPTVSSTDPADAATGVAVNKQISVVFSETMAASSITTSTFKLQSPAGPVAGTVSLLNNVALFKPTTTLAPSTVFTATVTTGVSDLSDNHLVVQKVWTFTTGTNPDTTAPRLISTDPVASATGVSINKKVSATFSENMDPSSVSPQTFFLKRPNGTFVPATLAYANKVAVLDPTSSLLSNTVYTATVTGGVKDSAGNAMVAGVSWSFKTAATGDTTPPTVVSTKPANLATNVFLNQTINATFSEAMQATTLNTATFKVDGVLGSVTYDTANHIASFNPTGDLAPNTTYTARIETGAKDSAGNGLALEKTWTFTTGIQRSQTQINLGAATTYAVLAGSTVTNAGPTIINGDLGVSPGTAVTGFPPGKVNGAMHKGDAAAAQAKTDLLVGQLDAAGRLGGAALPGDLSGLTFTPGLYKNATSTMLSAGAVTLDAQGDPNAVFIFQMGSTLTTSPGTQVVLAGGAKASNIYWSVGTSATLGVNSIFKGIILAEASITVNTGAVLDGTLLTKIGAVTLAANTVTRGIHKG
ncbi:antifreeze protein [Fimbriimonas ginsengisoli Gsoil 348]|uniref:Antifreeze protein n=1 Tax=Fimbriimonas ginsengisoli Gsoil 348 TaxID=661478 RepID=A0A068NQB4_FIMGI|nr:antifreeze protein [Fimbriimonas ginsengisoli Gsoil 348]